MSKLSQYSLAKGMSSLKPKGKLMRNFFYRWRWRIFKIPVIRHDIKRWPAPGWPFKEWEQPGPDFVWVHDNPRCRYIVEMMWG